MRKTSLSLTRLYSLLGILFVSLPIAGAAIATPLAKADAMSAPEVSLAVSPSPESELLDIAGDPAGIETADQPDANGNTPWPMFRHDRTHTGRSPHLGPQGSNLLWSFTTLDIIESSAAIGADGTVYVGSYDGRLYAIKPRKPEGEKKWEFATGGAIDSSPAISSNGTIYIGSNDAKLYAVNPDGTKQWEFTTGDMISCSPTIGPDGTIYIGSYDHYFYAVNPNGTEKWSFHTGFGWYSSAAIGADGTVYVGGLDNNVHALNPADGSEKWLFTTGGRIYSSPAIGPDGTIYVGSSDTYVHALEPLYGTEKWRFKAGASTYSSPAVGLDGTVYAGSHDGHLYALNPADGTELWRFTALDGIASSPAIGLDGTIYVGSYDHNLYAINPVDGRRKWKFTAADGVHSSPAIGLNRTLYVGSYDHKLYAIGSPVASPMVVKPTNYSFPYVVLGQPTAALVVTISNAAKANLVIAEMDLTDTTNYSLHVNAGSKPCGSETPIIPPGGSCTVGLRFDPPSAGDFDAVLTMVAMDPKIADGTVQLSGSGVPPGSATATIKLPAANKTEPPQNAYRMVGIPVIPDDRDLFHTLAGFFGGHPDRRVWRLWKCDGAGCEEILGPGRDIVDYGLGWWLISAGAKTLRITGATPLKSDFRKVFSSGYQMIACPFQDKSVTWADCLGDSANAPLSLGAALYYWDGSGEYVRSLTMDPGSTYWAWLERKGTFHVKRDYTSAPTPVESVTAPNKVIQPAPPTPPGAFVNVLSPKKSEVFQVGSSIKVRWNSLGISPQGFNKTVNIFFSKDGGKTYRRIASKIANTGSFSWKAPRNAMSQTCAIKVASSLYPSLLDKSDGFFTIK